MAKKKEKGAKKKDSAGPRDAVRGAVEGTFQRAAGGASKAQELLDEIGTTLKALRDANLVETLESVRDEVQTLAKRVAALELRSAEEEKPAPRRPAVRRTAASGTAAKKPAARKPAAKKPAAPRAKTATTPATTRKTTAARKPSTTRKAS